MKTNRFFLSTILMGLLSVVMDCPASNHVIEWGVPLSLPSDLTNLLAIASGNVSDHHLAIRADRTVEVWGDTSHGQDNLPLGLSNVVAIAGGWAHDVALKGNGTVVAWGNNFSYFTNAPTGQTNVPVGLSTVKAIGAGWYHSLAVRSNGTVVAWGANEYGQATVPVGLTGVVAVAGGPARSLALRANGSIVAWGTNFGYALSPPAEATNITKVAAGYFHSVGLKSDGTVVAWGADEHGQSTVPADLSNVVAIAAGSYHSLALKSDGTVVSWGLDSQSPPLGLANVSAISAGDFQNLALVEDSPTPPPPLPASILAGPITNPANGHQYYLLNYTNWPAAEQIAVSLGGHLATINNAAENNWVFTNFAAFGGVERTLWLGLNDAGQEQTWKWVSGESVGYFNWAVGEPNGTATTGTGEDYATMWNPSSGAPLGSWNDAPADMLNAAVIEIGAAEPPPPTILSGPITNSANGHLYYLLNYLSCPAAEQFAVSLGGHLATINDAAENQWIYDTFAGYEGGKRAMWIGLNDSASEGTWTWVSGEPVSYLNWSPGEPNSGAGYFPDEDHAVMWNASSGFPAGTWNDTGSNQLHSAIVEVPLPALVAPFITLQPTNQTVTVGSNVLFLVGVTGSIPLSFQWRFNGDDLPGRISSVLSLLNVQTANAGTYTVVITNGAGSITSAPAILVVNPPAPTPPTITAPPTNLVVSVGSNATFRVTATGTTPLNYQWRFNGTNLNGSISSVLNLVNVQFGNAGAYSVVVGNAGGSVTSSPAMLTVNPVAPCAPVFANLVSWWRGENDSLDSWGPNNGSSTVKFATGKVGQGFNVVGGFMQVPNAPSLRFTNALTVEAWVNPASSSSSTRTIVSKSDYFERVPDGTNSSFFVGLTNGNRPFFVVMPTGSPRTNVTIFAPQGIPTNQWSLIVATYNGAMLRLYINGSVVAQTNYSAGIFPGTSDIGVGGTSYLGGLFLPFTGTLDEVSLYNRALSDGEIVSIYNADGTGKCLQPPTIITQPADQSVPLGEDVKFTVEAVGSKPLVYQWFFLQAPIAGATNSSLVLEKVRANQAGSYQVRITNAFGLAWSTGPRLSVTAAPSCTATPEGLISWWPGDGNTFDAMGTNNILSITSVSFVTGKVDRAFSLSGFQSRMQLSNSPSLNFGSNADFSIEMWIRAAANGSNTMTLFEKRSEGTTSWVGYSLFLSQGRLAFALGSSPQNITNVSGFVSSGPDLRDAMFHHVAVTLDRDATNGGKLYVDGQAVLTFDPSKRNGSLSNTLPGFIGSPLSTISNASFAGLIDEPAIYSRALTPGDILAIRTAGAAGKCKVRPSIVTQPIGQRVTVGSNVTFSATAAGSPLLRYQWLRNNQNIFGATNSVYSFIVNNQAGGNYSLRVTNLFGSVVSSNAQLLVNFLPHAMGSSATVDEDQKITIFLFGSDDNPTDPLKAAIVTQPTHGTLGPLIQAFQPGGLIAVVDYTPAPNYNGPDSFMFKINDGLVDSAPVIINIAVVAVNDPPMAFNQSVALDEDTVAAITLGAADVDGDPLTFTVGAPVHGTLTGTPPNLTYHPETNYFGPDSFIFQVSDGQTNSNVATVSIDVRSVNDAPVASFTVSPLTDFPGFTNKIILGPLVGDAEVVLDGSASTDAENDPLQFFWSEGTNNFAVGTIVTNAFSAGTHQVTLVVSDGQGAGTNSATFEVITPSEAVGLIAILLEEGNPDGKNNPLLASLNGAMRAFDRGNLNPALNELKAFQNKVRAQIEPTNPELAGQLIASAQTIINELTPPEDQLRTKGTGIKKQTRARTPDVLRTRFYL